MTSRRRLLIAPQLILVLGLTLGVILPGTLKQSIHGAHEPPAPLDIPPPRFPILDVKEHEQQALEPPALADAAGVVSFGKAVALSEGIYWTKAIVDSAGDVGEYPSLALDADGYPHITYHDVTGDNLKYAYMDASGWHTETVDVSAQVGEFSSLALDSSGYGHVSYYDSKYKLLKHAYEDASGWTLFPSEMVDEGAGQHTSLALDSGNWAHISYLDETNGDLKYAVENSLGFSVETADNDAAYVGLYTSLALDPDEYAHISYWHGNTEDLLYAYKDTYGWHSETVDSNGRAGVDTALVLSSGGYPHISYYVGFGNWDDGELRYAVNYGSGWYTETVDSAGNTGRYTSIALDATGYPHISYANFDSGSVKYAYEEAYGWHFSTVTDNGEVGVDTSLVLDDDGNPHIVYYDYVNGDLIYAVGEESIEPPSDVPSDLQRRATAFLDELRNSGVASGWDSTATIGEPVRPLFRPDVADQQF